MSVDNSYIHVTASDSEKNSLDVSHASLHLLMCLAKENDRRGHILRLFLLGLYCPDAWPCELRDLRELDTRTQVAVLQVLTLDWAYPGSLRQFFFDREDLIMDWWKDETWLRRKYGSLGSLHKAPKVLI